MKNKGKIVIIVIVAVCIALLAVTGIFFLKFSSITEDVQTQEIGEKESDEKLYSMRTSYIGDNTKVSQIISSLHFGDELKYMGTELETSDSLPKTIKVIFSSANDTQNLSNKIKANFSYNSMIIFSLVENCEQVQLILNKNGESYPLESRQREWAKEIIKEDPFAKTQTLDDFKEYMKNISNIDFSKIATPTSNLEESIANAILESNKEKFYQGEFATQGHITLATDVDGVKTTAFVYQSYAEFRFENGIFERCSGMISPVSMTFMKDKYGNYTLFEYKIPQEGNMYEVHLQELFPEDIISQIKLYNSNESQLEPINNQLVASAKEYLNSIGREDAKIALNYQEKNYPPLSSQNSEIYDILYRAYADFPYHVGSIEQIENHIRYEYKTSYEKDSNADIFTYTKTNLNTGTVEENTKIQIKNGELTALEGTVREDFYNFKKSYDEDQKAAQDYKN